MTDAMPCEPFDKREIFDKEVTPIINKLYKLCKEHSIPMHVIAIAMANGEGCHAHAAHTSATEAHTPPQLKMVIALTATLLGRNEKPMGPHE